MRARAHRLIRRARGRLADARDRLRAPLVRFIPLSVFAIVAIGLTVYWCTAALVTNRAHSRATRDAQLFADYVVAPAFAAVPPGPLDAPTIAQVTVVLGPSRPASSLSAVTLVNSEGMILWADDPTIIGHHRLQPTDVRKAHSRVIAGGTTFLTSVPVRRGGQVFATMYAYAPYQPIAAARAHDLRELTGLIVGGLLLLYLVLVPVVMGAYRRLHRHASAQEHLAVHDTLTGLANRALLREEAMRALARSRRRETHMAVLLIDLDKFKEVNDTLGHHAGDVLLKQVAARLDSVVRDSDLLARLGGDEFAILAEDIGRPEHMKILAERLLHVLLEPFNVEDIDLEVGCSIGIAVYPGDGEDVDTLMQHADAAMYRAKVIRNAYAMYHPSQDGLEPERVSLVSNLRGALDSNQIVVHYQPKVDVDSGRIVGVEALVRWEHPQRGCMLPDEFLEAVESAGLTPILADHVLDRALGQCRTWLDLGMTVPVSVNLSARSLEDAHLHHKVAAALAKWSVPASYLELEFAEATIMPEADRADDTLARLAERGVRIAVDGFAIGYSSLVRLQQLPLTSIKIDRSYLLDVERDTDKQAMVRTVINLAHDLGYAAVAVGVESAEAWHLLRALHCDLAQGFFFSRPQPAPALESLLRQHNPTEMMAVRY